MITNPRSSTDPAFFIFLHKPVNESIWHAEHELRAKYDEHGKDLVTRKSAKCSQRSLRGLLSRGPQKEPSLATAFSTNILEAFAGQTLSENDDFLTVIAGGKATAVVQNPVQRTAIHKRKIFIAKVELQVGRQPTHMMFPKQVTTSEYVDASESTI